MTPRNVVVAIACAITVLGACVEQKSERERLVEASTLAQRGDTEEAREIFEDLLEANPDGVDVLIRYAGFLVDVGELEPAGTHLDRLAAMDLRGTDAARLEHERRRYFQRIYDAAKGDAPASPADRDAYERGIIGLINIERGGPLLDEYNSYLIMQARAALGRNPERQFDQNDFAVARAATQEQIANALAYLDRLIDGDPRCQVRREPEGRLLDESVVLRTALQVERFRAAFEQRWTSAQRDAFVRDGRFDLERQRFLHHYVGPYREEYTADSGLERLTHQAQTWHAREIATDLAYELAGIPRVGAEPLRYRVEDFAETEATNVGATPDGQFTFDLSLPYDTILHGGWLLQQRLDAPAAEGSGAAPGPADGSGAPGSGSGAPGSATPAPGSGQSP